MLSTPKKHSELSAQISQRWIEYISAKTTPLIDLLSIHEEFDELIRPYDDNAPILFNHPIWTLVRKYEPQQPNCTLFIAEYYLWILNTPHLSHLSSEERLVHFWEPLFPRMTQRTVELWILHNHSAITNIHVRLHWVSHQRKNRWLARIRKIHTDFPEYVMSTYTWLLVIPGWVIHFLLFVLWLWWHESDGVSYFDKSEDIPSIRETFYQSLDETMPWFGQVAQGVTLGTFGLLTALFCFLIMSLLWCLGGVFFSTLPILIILGPAELLTKKPFRYGYMGLATCSMITGMVYLYSSLFISFIYEFPYTKNLEPWDAVERVWSHYPNYLLQSLLEDYVIDGGMIWMPILMASLVYFNDLKKYTIGVRKRTQSYIDRIEFNQVEKHLRHYWTTLYKQK